MATISSFPRKDNPEPVPLSLGLRLRIGWRRVQLGWARVPELVRALVVALAILPVLWAILFGLLAAF